MEVKAHLRFLRMSPRKVRLVVNTIRGLSVAAAETKLQFVPKLASEPVLKLLLSAVANANHNFHLQKEDLYVKSIVADGGPTLKRFRARAFGRAAPIRKRTTHITIVLADKKDKPAKAEAAPKKVVRAKKAATKKTA